MKKLIIISLITVISLQSFAQDGGNQGFRIGGGLTVAIPASKNLKAYSVGVGLDLLAQYGITSQFALTGDVGYTTIFAKNKDNDAFNVIPIRGGIRFYPSDKFYLGGKAGVGILTGNGSSSSGFAYAVGGGFKMDDKLDIGLNYESVTKKILNTNYSFGYLGLRLGYFFN
ncbi:MAG: outer membrane beta-barrel protein [Ferruginibacter sp.]